MKKIVILMVMMALLVACGGKNKVEDGKKVIYVGTNAEYKPYEYLENGEIVGFDIDLMKEIGSILGYEVEWSNMAFDGLLPALQSGKVDMIIAGMTPTPERVKAVDFTDVYYSSNQIVLMNKETGSPIQSKEELKGKSIGVQLGSLQEKLAGDLGASEVKRYNSFTGAILDLNADKIDYVIVGGAVADFYLNENPKVVEALEIVDAETADGAAIALKKGNENMVEDINKAIAEIKSSGKYDELVKKYFSN